MNLFVDFFNSRKESCLFQVILILFCLKVVHFKDIRFVYFGFIL